MSSKLRLKDLPRNFLFLVRKITGKKGRSKPKVKPCTFPTDLEVFGRSYRTSGRIVSFFFPRNQRVPFHCDILIETRWIEIWRKCNLSLFTHTKIGNNTIPKDGICRFCSGFDCVYWFYVDINENLSYWTERSLYVHESLHLTVRCHKLKRLVCM